MKTKKEKIKEEIIASLKLAETEEGRTGLVTAFLAKEETEKEKIGKSKKE